MVDFAIIQTGGKQYRVKDGDTIRVERLPDDEGDTVVIDDVRMVSLNGAINIGTPKIPGASVTTEVVNKGRDKKSYCLQI
jgi:large subunit ribosomal protein L21